MTPPKSDSEGWADLRPIYGHFAFDYRRHRGTARRSPRAQHYFLNGRSLCGRRSLTEEGFHPPELTVERPGLARMREPPCARCEKRASSPLFQLRRRRRLRTIV